MARVRIFLFTHRRPLLLRRALVSLLAQTDSDWRCELHNDAPDDDEPRTILQDVAPADPRFTYHAHERNWGAVASFNHAYAGGPEAFASLLEDDNWWEPDFLASAFAALTARPNAALVWANMRIWQEQSDLTWTDTRETIWRVKSSVPQIVEFSLPELLQAFDALHSNGAMMFRPDRFKPSNVPLTTPFAIVEQMRERAATGSLLLLTKPLANFARTLTTARDSQPSNWLQAKLLLAASFFKVCPVTNEALEKIWEVRRNQRPRDVGIFFYLALILRDRRLVASARVSDWLHFLLNVGRHPSQFLRGLRFRGDHPEVWNWLCAQTAANARPVTATVYTKQI